MTKHTPLIRLQAAQSAYKVAVEACPHWDFEGGPDSHECCYVLDEAARELRLAKKAVRS